MRRTFTLDALPTAGQISLTIHHDEDAEVYINGQLVTTCQGYTTGYAAVPLSPAAKQGLPDRREHAGDSLPSDAGWPVHRCRRVVVDRDVRVKRE